MKKILKIALQSLQLQLFLNIISILIVAYWGLPISYLAPLGNIIFSPILTIFLLLSSSIFFLELLRLPNQGIIWLLERVTHAWSNIMLLVSKSFVINLSKPSKAFTIFIVICICTILQSKRLRTSTSRIIVFSCIFMIMIINLGYTQIPEHDIQKIFLGRKSIMILNTKGIVSIVDQGGLGQQACTRAWINFTLLPLLRQNYATDIITHLIALRPTTKTFQILNEFSQATVVKNTYIPHWQGITPNNLKKAYMDAATTIQKNGKLHRISNKKIHIPLTQRDCIEILPQKSIKKHQTIHFFNIDVVCITANTMLALNHTS